MRTLADYRPQHDDTCLSRSPFLGVQMAEGEGPCTCGLLDLLSSSRGETRRRRVEEQEDGAALLPSDPSAAIATEALPTSFLPRADNSSICRYCGLRMFQHQITKAAPICVPAWPSPLEQRGPTVEEALDDFRMAWSPDIGTFSSEECEDRLQKLIVAVRAQERSAE